MADTADWYCEAAIWVIELEQPNQKSWFMGSRITLACQAVTASWAAARVLPPHPLVLLPVKPPQLELLPPGPYP